MNLADYAITLFRRAQSGILLPFRPGILEGWVAKEHQCHLNALEWCARNIGDTRVPGWLYFDFGGFFEYVRFTAHTVVKTGSGEFRDITPSQASRPYPFIAAVETQEQYDEVVERQKIMHLDLYLSDGRVQVHTLGEDRAV